MTHHGHWKIFKPVQIQSAVPRMLIPTDQVEKAAVCVPMTQAMVDLLMAIISSKVDMKGSSVHRVLRMWLAHQKYFSYYATALHKVDH